jgi:hypothetical protein
LRIFYWGKLAAGKKGNHRKYVGTMAEVETKEQNMWSEKRSYLCCGGAEVDARNEGIMECRGSK